MSAHISIMSESRGSSRRYTPQIGLELYWGEFQDPLHADQLSEELAAMLRTWHPSIHAEAWSVRLGGDGDRPSLRFFLRADESVSLQETADEVLNIFDRAGVPGYRYTHPEVAYQQCRYWQQEQIICCAVPDATAPLMTVPIVTTPPFPVGIVWNLRVVGSDTCRLGLYVTIPSNAVRDAQESTESMIDYVRTLAEETGGTWCRVSEAMNPCVTTDPLTATDVLPCGWPILPSPPGNEDGLTLLAIAGVPGPRF